MFYHHGLDSGILEEWTLFSTTMACGSLSDSALEDKVKFQDGGIFRIRTKGREQSVFDDMKVSYNIFSWIWVQAA